MTPRASHDSAAYCGNSFATVAAPGRIELYTCLELHIVPASCIVVSDMSVNEITVHLADSPKHDLPAPNALAG